jgi:CBS domain-containing protein
MAQKRGLLNKRKKKQDQDHPKMVCPSCRYENIPGDDRCAQCLHSLMQRDLPRPRKDDLLQATMMTVPVGDLLTGIDLLVAHPNDTIEKLVKTFQSKHKHCVLVYEHKKLVGILSARDLVLRVAGKLKNPDKVKIREVMTPNPEFVQGDDTISHVLNRMAMGGCRHVPVLAPDGAPYSIISINDVLAYLATRLHAA